MIESIDTSLFDWSRAQFALTAMYHWVFVPLTLGLAVIMAVMETIYYKTGDEFWKKTAKFWMKLFGINFAIGVATGLILEFQFGTNWSNYSWFVGDIFGAPLAIEGIVAFFMEATFIAVMFFGWDKVSKRFHLASTWLTGLGATISAWWILVANAWMQNPVGMEFNPDTYRNEMASFVEVATSPFAVNKFFHTVLSGWVLGAVFVVGVSAWFLLKKRDTKFALASMKIAAIFGLVSTILVATTGHGSAVQVAKKQPMKLAAAEGLYEGGNGVGLVAFGILNPDKTSYNDGKDPFLFKIEMPKMLSYLSNNDFDCYVPGIKDIIEGGYTKCDGVVALSTAEKINRGKIAIKKLAEYKEAKEAGETEKASEALKEFRANDKYFGYGYMNKAEELIPNIPLNFYAFRVMVLLGGYFIAFFILVIFLVYRGKIEQHRWLQKVALWTIPLGYIAGQAGWIVAECGRQPWAIQDLMPIVAAISKVPTTSVQITFFIFLLIFTVMFCAGLNIMLKEIKKGPEHN